MRYSNRWPGLVAMAALILVGTALAQSPDRGPPGEVFGPPTLIGVDDIVEHIMRFDKNKDGKLTRDELPERMHGLFARGDSNKDGALDRDEIRKLASTPSGPGPADFGFRVQTRVGPGPGGPMAGFGAGPGPGGPGARVRVDAVKGGAVAGFRGGPGPGLGGDIEGVVDDLKLASDKKARALAAVKAHEANIRKLMDQARADLVQNMKEILSEEELNDFKAALDRPRGATRVFFNFGPKDAPPPGAVERKLEKR